MKHFTLSPDKWHVYHILTYLILSMWVHVTYLFTKRVTKSCDSLDWLIQFNPKYGLGDVV